MRFRTSPPRLSQSCQSSLWHQILLFPSSVELEPPPPEHFFLTDLCHPKQLASTTSNTHLKPVAIDQGVLARP